MFTTNGKAGGEGVGEGGSPYGRPAAGLEQRGGNAVAQLLAEQGPTEQALAQAQAMILGMPNAPAPTPAVAAAAAAAGPLPQEGTPAVGPVGEAPLGDSPGGDVGAAVQGTAIESDLLREWYALQELEQQQQQQREVQPNRLLSNDGASSSGSSSGGRVVKMPGAAKSALAAAAAAAAARRSRSPSLLTDAGPPAAAAPAAAAAEPGAGHGLPTGQGAALDAQPQGRADSQPGPSPRGSVGKGGSGGPEPSPRRGGAGGAGVQGGSAGAGGGSQGEAGRTRAWGSWAPNTRIKRAGVSLLRRGKAGGSVPGSQGGSKAGSPPPTSIPGSSEGQPGAGRAGGKGKDDGGADGSGQRTEDGAMILSQRVGHARPWKRTRAPTERQATVKVGLWVASAVGGAGGFGEHVQRVQRHVILRDERLAGEGVWEMRRDFLGGQWGGGGQQGRHTCAALLSALTSAQEAELAGGVDAAG